MNKIYKLVWSKVRNTWVVASEIAKGHGKNASATRERKLLKTAVITAIMGGCLMTGGLASAELTPEQKVVYDAVMAELEKGGGVHYFSVKSKDQMPNYNKDGAQGENSVAIGPGSTTKRRDSLSIGTSNTNDGYETVLVGNQNKAYGLDRGYEYASGATIVGTGNTIMSYKGTMAMGSENIVYQGIAIGAKNKAMGENAVALGNFSSAMYTDSVGIGFGTHGDADGVVAIGRAAKGDALAGVAIGRYAEVHASTGVALGDSSVSSRGAGVVGYMPGAVGQTAEEVAAYLGKAEEYKSWKADVEKNKDAYTRAKAWHAAVDAERKAFREINEARIAYAENSTEENKKAITEKYDAWKKASDERQKTDVAMRPDFKTINDLNARYGQIFGKLMSTEGAVSVGDEKTGRTRQIINVAAGTKDTDAVNVYQLKALNTKMDKGAIHYFSVKSDDSARPAGTNWNNDGATGNGAVAIGEKAMAAKGGTVSIGRNAQIKGDGGNTDGEGSVAIGDNSLITTNGLDLASIAIGKNAKVLNGSGKQERGLSFTPDNFDKPGFFGGGDTLPKNADKVPGGIAIGTNSYARTGSIQLGHHTFDGYKMGGIDVTNANEEANIVGMTTVGTNTYNKGALANMYGAYSIITGDFTGAGGMNSLTYGPQNFGANVVGSLNSIRSKGHGGSSGVANSIVGVANTVENANGTLVYGAGNKITNSVTSISAPSGLTTLNTWEDTVTALQKSIKDSKSGGAVLAIGGGNVADYVRHSQLVGVNNTVTGTENKVSDFNMVNGYQNTGTNITHVTMIGSENQVTDTKNALVFGDKRKLTGADGSIVLGSADAKADKKVETNVKDATVIGHNANTTVEGGVALGSDSVADRAGFTKEKKGVFSDVDLNGKTAAAVSVGTKDKLRQIINVGDATEDTDAVNLRQLKVVNAKADKNAEAITNLTNTVNANGKATIVKVDGNENNADGNLKIKKTEKDGQLTYDLSLNDEISLGKAGEDGKDGKIGLTGKDGTSAEIRTGQGKAGVDGKDGETTTRIIYKDKGGKDHEVATLDDGLKFKGDNDTVVTRKLNEQLNITGGITDAKELSDNNIGVVGTQDGGMAVKLSKKLKGLTSAEFKDGDNVTNITAGDVTVTKKEGNETKTVNIWDLNKTVNDIKTGATDVSSWKLQANGKDERIIKKDSVVNFKNGENTKVTVKGNDVTVDLNDATKKQINDNTTNIKNIDGRVTKIENSIDQKIEGAKVTVEGDKETGVTVENTAEAGKPVNYKVSLDDKVKVGNVTIDGKDSKGEITGLTNTTIDGTDFAKKGRAATEEQLKAVEDKIGQTGSEAKKHASVTAGTNISVVQDGTNKEGGKNYKVSLAKDIDLGQDGSIKAGNTIINKDGVTTNTVKAGDTTINNDGLTIKDGPAITKTNVDVNNQQIHHVKDGTAVDDAATVGQVNKKIDEITKTVTSSSVTGGTIGEDGKISLTKADKTTVELQGQLKDISARAGDYEIKDNKVTIGLEDNYSKNAAGNIVIKDVAKASALEQETKERKDADKVITETIGAANKDELKTSYQNTTYIKNSTTLVEADKALDKAISKNAGDIKKNTETINILGKQVGNLDTRVNKVGAGAAALAALHPLDFDPDDKWDFAAGYGNYKGANAAAIGAYYRPNEDTMFSVGGSFGGGENMVNAGVSVKLGQGNHVSTSKVAMAKDMLAMQKRMAEMEAQMAKMQGFIGALTGMDTQAAMFPDVPENHWAYEYVKGLCEKGIIEGYPDGNFNGNRSMTRYEFAAMLYRALAKGVNLDARAVKEFAPELGRIRVDVISQNKEGQPVIERVRVNEEKKEK